MANRDLSGGNGVNLSKKIKIAICVIAVNQMLVSNVT